MSLSKDCIQYSGNKKDCPVAQKGKTYRVVNFSNSMLTIYEVDPCLIPEIQQKKCDYLVLVENPNQKKVFFIELKGSDLTGAIRQIENSVRILGCAVKGYQVFGRIIGRRITPNIKSRRAALDEKLRELGGNLHIASAVDYSEEV